LPFPSNSERNPDRRAGLEKIHQTISASFAFWWLEKSMDRYIPEVTVHAGNVCRTRFWRNCNPDESWFQYSSYSDSMFADSRENAMPRIREDISAQKTMILIFFTSRRLLVLETLPKDTKFNQDYCIQGQFPWLYSDKTRISGMDNSMCHHGRKVSGKWAQKSIERAPHPPYSPDISPCDFWLYGILKHNMTDREFRNQQETLNAIAKIWDDLTFEDVQRVFQEWMERLTWVIGHNGEYCSH
jgi:hypothetical protein